MFKTCLKENVRYLCACSSLGTSDESNGCTYNTRWKYWFINMYHFIEVFSVMFCILSDIASSSKEQTFDVTINPESCRPEVSMFFFLTFSSAIFGDFGYVVQDMLKNTFSH